MTSSPEGRQEAAVAWRWRPENRSDWEAWTFIKVRPEWLEGPGFVVEPLFAPPAPVAAVAPAVNIKPLEWRPHISRAGWLAADTPPGGYFAWELGGFGYWSHGSIVGREVHGGLEAAKAAAQADFEARIRSALIPARPAVEVVEALNDKAHDLIMRAVDLACNHLIFYDQHFDIEARQKFYDIRDDMRQWLVDVADAALQAPATPDAQTEVGK